MGRYVRQQLLKPFSYKSSKQGQAMIEILPAVMIFVVVLMSGLAYFRVMRAAVIRQEVVRNAMFAVIHNSGSLTTPPNLTQVSSGDVIGGGVDVGAGRVVASTRMTFIDNQTN